MRSRYLRGPCGSPRRRRVLTAGRAGALAVVDAASFDVGLPRYGPLPRTEQVSVDTTVDEWSLRFSLTDPDGHEDAWSFAYPETFEAGQRYEETFNVGVFGPAITVASDVARSYGDWLDTFLLPFADGARHDSDSAYTDGSVPLTVQGSAAGDHLGSLTVSYSVDGGDTWQEAPVEGGAIKVANPAAGGSVSLRAEVTDTDGNASTQTIIDAYRTT